MGTGNRAIGNHFGVCRMYAIPIVNKNREIQCFFRIMYFLCQKENML